MSRSAPPAAALVALLVASAVVPALSVGATPQSVAPTPASVTSHPQNGPQSLTCAVGVGSGLATAEDPDRNVSVSTWVAPGSADDELTDASAIADATSAGRVTPLDGDATVAPIDLAVHRIDLNGSAVGLLDRLGAQDRGSPTANFRALVREAGVEFEYSGPTACPPRLALNETVERGALRVVPDRRDGALFLVVDVGRAAYYALGSDTELAPDDRWDYGHHAVRLGLRKSSGLVAENVTAEAHYDVGETRAQFAAETEGLVRLSPGANATIRGRATVAPGTEIRVRLRPVEAPTGVLNATATVNRSRGFAARFDLSGVGDDALYAARMVEAERDEDYRRTTLVAVGNATGGTLFVGTPESEGLRIDDVSAATTDGGFVVVRNASGGIVGVSEFFGPGRRFPKPDLRPPIRSDQNASVTLYRDSNGNRTFDPADEPYRANGSVVRGIANVTIEGSPPEVPTTRTTTTLGMPERRTAAATETPEAPTRTAETPTSATETTDGDTTASTTRVPGFDSAAAVLALLASLVALRRR
ncbi:DUF7282 domain-containing protein [Halorussus caseinilyticus]|uniref:DUF7282 domain-containing protein n=1 Tax=Halorussus caseinilyticus TaxID=3034025 RepID=A0ABD5WNN6_9EURY|nr:hypothetical protein [Halorussus sp. DT72]